TERPVVGEPELGDGAEGDGDVAGLRAVAAEVGEGEGEVAEGADEGDLVRGLLPLMAEDGGDPAVGGVVHGGPTRRGRGSSRPAPSPRRATPRSRARGGSCRSPTGMPPTARARRSRRGPASWRR